MIQPKPRFPLPKPSRLSERKAVTIIAGFKCNDGIVLCADTQETIEHSKRQVPKLRLEPSPYIASAKQVLTGKDLAVAFCGAGSGPFIDKLVDRAWQSAKDATGLDDACRRIDESIQNMYKEYGQIYQFLGGCPQVEIIFGVKMEGKSRLFKADGPIVNEKDRYESGGIGYYMADFLASKMYNYNLTVNQLIVLSLYVVFEAKEHVDGCGGESHLAVLRNQGHTGREGLIHTLTVTELLKEIDRRAASIVLDSADMSLDDARFRIRLNETTELIVTDRQTARGKLEDWQKFLLNLE
jgi:20S proteasome alpha/beta subunit